MVGVELLFDVVVVVVAVVVVVVVIVGDLLAAAAAACVDLSEDIPAQVCLGGLA